jgi:CDP-glucose 4,6-dehydratase
LGVIPDLGRAFGGRRVLVTGHTGFKGAWLALWLNRLGARVTGYSLPPPTTPSLFELANVRGTLADHIAADVRDRQRLAEVVRSVRPDYVFHLAAQSLVRESYRDPWTTLETNAMGTASLLEAVRALDKPCAVVVVTSDKCYENREQVWGYRECDPMGGHDPYSMSKGCTELLVASWRRSFFQGEGAARVATARAGNVIGGGDWAKDRIVVDCIEALRRGVPIQVRYPQARRPWQHVLEPLSGYLTLGAALAGERGAGFAEAWNFGPDHTSVGTVRELVEDLLAEWGSGEWRDVSSATAPHEAGWLSLCCDKALYELGWRPVWSRRQAVQQTVKWCRAWVEGRTDLAALCGEQIAAYEKDRSQAAATAGGGALACRP